MSIPHWRGRRRDEDLDEELKSHLRMATQDRVERGEAPGEAAVAARREFGNVGLVREVTRDQWGWGWLERLARDLQYAFRGLLHNRVYALAAILTLALGIGANTAIFSLLDSLVLRVLPVRDPARLVLLSAGENGEQGDTWSHPVFEEIRRRARQAEFCAWNSRRFDIARAGETEMVNGLLVTGRFFDVLGVHAALGRTLGEADDRRGGGPDGPVAVISHAFWQRHFGSAPDILGKPLTLNRIDTPFRIVGVTAPGFSGLQVGRSFDVALPLSSILVLSPGSQVLDSSSSSWLQLIARLERGRSAEAATAALRGVQTAIREATAPAGWNAEQVSRYLRWPFTLQPAATGVSPLRATYERPLVALMVIVALVLAVACANVANLQLARVAARRHELAVRRALGASRLSLARQLLAESLLLAVAGAALGLLLAIWGSDLLAAQLSTSVSKVFLDLGIDRRLLAFVTSVSAVTVVFFGTVPAFRAARAGVHDALQNGRGPLGSGRHTVNHAFVVVQVGLSLVLVVAAGLFLRSFTALATRHTGLEVDRVLAVSVTARQGAVGGAIRPVSSRAIMDAVSALPGVERVSFCSMVPLAGGYATTAIEIPGGPTLPGEDRTVLVNAVGPGWFATIGIPIVSGRDFSPDDSDRTVPVVVVNQALARRFFGDGNALGRTILGRGSKAEVVGVVEDALYNDLRAAARPTMYHANPPTTSGTNFVIRSARGAAAALAPGIVSAIANLDPALSLTARPVSDYANAAVAKERIVAMLSGFFGALALLLAAIGVFGVTTYGVHRRQAEIGLRIALGASSGGVMRLVLGRVTVLIALGIALGGAASFWASRLVGSLLFGIEPRDPATFVGAAIVLAFVGMVAGAIPAWRAARVDPTTVMRSL